MGVSGRSMAVVACACAVAGAVVLLANTANGFGPAAVTPPTPMWVDGSLRGPVAAGTVDPVTVQQRTSPLSPAALRQCYTYGSWQPTPIAHHQWYSATGDAVYRPFGGPGGALDWVLNDPSNCGFVPYTPKKFCDVLGSRNILFAGDSMMLQLWSGLSKSFKGSGDERCLTQLTHLRNDNLSLKPPPRYLFQHAYADDWTGAVLSGKYDVIVLNTAIHILPEVRSGVPCPPEFSGNMDDKVYRDKVTAAAQFLHHNFNGTVIYVSAYSGHDCYNLSTPLKEPPALHFRNADRYKWWRVPRLNEIAFEAFEEAGATIMEVEPMLKFREDGHKWAPVKRGMHKSDCLHYALPGPSDMQNWVLMNLLMQQSLTK